MTIDKIKPQQVKAGENEVLLREDNKWLYFSEAHQILTAERVEEVLPRLREIEELVEKKGWYAAGFLSYEAAPAFDPVLKTHPLTDFLYLWFGLFPEPQRVILPEHMQSKEAFNWQLALDPEAYSSVVERIKDHIANGRTYQVNYTMRLQTDFTTDAWNFFQHLAQHQNTHAAYVNTGHFAICSASPELFFQLDGETITCRPMKGTIQRGRTTREDKDQSEKLATSEKNRAENVMIVDMIRNDLGRIAEIGTVRVPRLFEVERYPTLWQMTSTVKANTMASVTDILTALFPCASITGAPKVSTMKIISELENTPRKIYTGSLGYIAPDRKAKFNVAIRTALIDRQLYRAEYGLGGGIVWDSNTSEEYAEALLKARVLTGQRSQFSLLETMLWTPEEGFFLYDLHLARMLDSANYFAIPVTKEKLEEYLEYLSSSFKTTQRVQVLLDQAGNLSSSAGFFLPEKNPKSLNVCLAKKPVDTNNIFLFHKTTQRSAFEAARQGSEECDDVLLYNESGELTEFTIGNLVVKLDGQLFTPPVSCGLLPGTFRAHLMETGQVVERTIPVAALRECTKIFRVNSIRKWQQVHLH